MALGKGSPFLTDDLIPSAALLVPNKVIYVTGSMLGTMLSGKSRLCSL